MPLQVSRRIAKVESSYAREITRHTKILLTGGAIALVLAVVALFGILRGPITIPGPNGSAIASFTPSPWLVAVGVLLILSWVQYRVWRSTSDQLRALISSLYEDHPIDGDGINVQQVRINTGLPGQRSRPFLQASVVLERIKASEILVTCDGRLEFAKLVYPLPEDECKPGDIGKGVAPVTHGTSRATIISPSSFRVQSPPVPAPVQVSLEIHGDPIPAIVCVEWSAP